MVLRIHGMDKVGVRFPVGPPKETSRPTRGVPRVRRPLRLTARFHSDFLRGGGISEKEWAAKTRGGAASTLSNKFITICRV